MQRVAYACYVLAAAGHPEMSTMVYLKNNRLDALSDYSQFQLAGAFAFSGDLNTALSMLPTTIVPKSDDGVRESGGQLKLLRSCASHYARCSGGSKSKSPFNSNLVKRLTDSASNDGGWYTTQENAFAFLALGKILKNRCEATTAEPLC